MTTGRINQVTIISTNAPRCGLLPLVIGEFSTSPCIMGNFCINKVFWVFFRTWKKSWSFSISDLSSLSSKLYLLYQFKLWVAWIRKDEIRLIGAGTRVLYRHYERPLGSADLTSCLSTIKPGKNWHNKHWLLAFKGLRSHWCWRHLIWRWETLATDWNGGV